MLRLQLFLAAFLGAAAACTVNVTPHCSKSLPQGSGCESGSVCLVDSCVGLTPSTLGCAPLADVLSLNCRYFGEVPNDSTDTDTSSTPSDSDSTTDSSSNSLSSTPSNSNSNSSDPSSSSSNSSDSSSTPECSSDPDCVANDNGSVCASTGPNIGTCVPCEAPDNDACSDPATPVCNDNNTCVACLADTHCSILPDSSNVCITNPDSTLNICVDCQDDSHCVESDITPICDTNAHSCEPCSGSFSDNNCPDDSSGNKVACFTWQNQTLSGACLGSEVIWVGGAGCKDDGPGTPTIPKCSLQSVINDANADSPITIRLNSLYPGGEDISVSGAKTIAIIGTSSPLELSGNSANFALSVSGDSTLLLQDVKWTLHPNSAISCDNSNLWLNNVLIDSGDEDGSTGISSTSCNLWANQLFVLNNKVYGVQLNGGTTTLQNTAIGSNGDPDVALSGGLALSNSASLSLNYVTIASNSGKNAGQNLACSDASSSVILRNSLVTGAKSDSIDPACPSLGSNFTTQSSVTDDTNFTTGSGLTVLSDDQGNAVRTLLQTNLTLGDDAAGLTALEGLATRSETDPELDIQGNDRPDPGPDFPGADEPGND